MQEICIHCGSEIIYSKKLENNETMLICRNGHPTEDNEGGRSR